VLRIVLDTNILVSGIISASGPSARILDAWRDHRFLLVTSVEILEEVRRVLRYPRIADKYHISSTDVRDLMNLLEQEAVVLSNIPEVSVVLEDPDDNKFLACALQAEADFIASGDRHLLAIREHGGIPVVTARALMEYMESGKRA
jgi:putative PIN family toxin of toxin-antitoxin system